MALGAFKYNKKKIDQKLNKSDRKRYEVELQDKDILSMMERPIDETSLNDESSYQHVVCAKWANLYSKSIRKASAAKNKFKQVEAEVRLELRDKKLRRDIMDAMVESNPKVLEAAAEYEEAEALKEEYKNIVKAAFQRGEMIKEMNANRRRELVD